MHGEKYLDVADISMSLCCAVDMFMLNSVMLIAGFEVFFLLFLFLFFSLKLLIINSWSECGLLSFTVYYPPLRFQAFELKKKSFELFFPL